MTTKSMGINRDTLVFHGTTGNFDNFDIDYLRQPSTPSDEAKVIFFTTEYDKALAHAKRKASLINADPVVIKAYIKYKNLYDATAAIRVNRHKFKTYSQTKRYIYNKVDVNKYDAVEIRGDDVNTPEIAVFDPSVIKIVKNKNNVMEAADKKTTIIKNPTAAQIKRLIKNEPYHEIKGWIEGKDVYFWNNVEEWHHADQAETLGISKDKVHTRANNLNKLVIMPIAQGGYNKNSKDFALVHYGWNDDQDKLKGIRVFLNSPYLRGIIKDLDLYIDDPHGERLGSDDHDLVNYIKGTDYMKMLMLSSDFNELLCWIDADGREIEVTGTDATHAGTFRRLCNDDPSLKSRFEETFPNYSQNNAYIFCTRDLGWIRVSGHGRYVGVMITKSRVSPRASTSLAKILKDYDYDEFILEYHESYNDDNNETFYKLSDLIAEVRKNVSKTLTASYAGTSEYGYWLHDGKIGNVEHQAHDLYIRKHFSDKKLGAEPWSYGFKQGWIRAVNERTGNLAIELWYDFVDRGALKALSELINRRNTYKGFIVEINRGTGNAILPEHLRKRWFTFKEDEEKQVLHLVRQCLKDESMTAMEEQYGYWFTDKGEQLDVEEMAHNRVARKYIENHKEVENRFNAFKSTDTYNDIYKNFALKELGWIRCTITDERLDVEIFPGKVDSKAFKAFRQYVDKESLAEEFLLDIINTSNRFLNRDRKQALYNDIQKQVNKTLTANDDYGYWITDKGNVIKVNYEDHNNAIFQYIHDNLYKEYLRWVKENDIADATEFAIMKGCIRIVAEGEILNVEIDKTGITKEAYSALSKFYNSTYFDRINVDVGFQRRTTTSKRFSAYSNDLNKFLPFMRTYIRKDKTIVAIDGDNNVTGRYSQIAIERWQPDNSADQIQLLNIGQDFVIRSITGSDSYDLEPFRFIETARKALLDMVRDMEKTGIIYKKQAIEPIHLYSSDDETVIKRWETGSGKHAITLVKDKYGYSINNFIRVLSGEYKKDGSSFLGKADLDQAISKINAQLELYKNVDGTGFKEVKVSKVLENLVPKKEAQKVAQVTVRGKVQDQLDGFKKFSKQPDVPGLVVYVSKAGSFQYAKIVHEPSNLALVSLTKKPLSISPSELVERIDLSKLKNYNWMLPQDQLFKKYGPTVLADLARDFVASLDMKKMDKTDQALESGLKNWVKDYLIAIYLKRPDGAKNLMKQIDKDIKDKGLNKDKVYFYYGNPSIKSEEVWKKVGLVRIGTSAPYKYEFADKVQYTSPPALPPTNLSPVQQVIVLINQGYPLDAAVKQIAKTKGEIDTLRRDVKLVQQKSSRLKDEKKSVAKEGMIGSYITGIDKFGDKVSGILITEKRDPKTYKSSGTAIIIDEDGAPVKVKLTGVRRKLVKPPTALTKAYKVMTASLRLEASGKTKEELRDLNKGKDIKEGYHSYRLKIGSYCQAEIKRKKQVGFGYSRKFVDHTDIVKGILVKENSYKNKRAASGGLLIDAGKDKETGAQNYVVSEVVNIKPIFRKPPVHLKDKYNNLVKAGKIMGGKEIK